MPRDLRDDELPQEDPWCPECGWSLPWCVCKDAERRQDEADFRYRENTEREERNK